MATSSNIELGVVMDPIGEIKVHKDTTFALLLEAQARSWDLFYMEMNDLYLRDGRTYARMRRLSLQRDAQRWYSFEEECERPLDDLDVILMRKDPPFDQEYIYATYLLECAEQRGTLVVNKPRSLRDANEKLFTAWFPQCCAPTLVSRDVRQFRQFLREQGEIILKPLDGMGGASIFYLHPDDPNFSVVMELMTAHGRRFVMAQKYLPEIAAGDKRILLINGEPVPHALARVPASGELRGNLAAGGRAEGRALTDRDRWICAQVGPQLRERGLIFVGIDVIGDYLTEINVTSPTCVQELDKLFKLNISAQLMNEIEGLLKR
ncbi:glutathione synthase [Methylohalobius crimeensis]|uniref:glutathione synthase n=1 Tax=Methylohalobius crimeensis TaxID=244365 RepID=UPI0003B4DA4F|nr:glutathione synthase [Methylohalobius crimeensis]